MNFNFFLLLGFIFCFNGIECIEDGKFFEVVFLDYVHEYNEVYANVDIGEKADYKGYLCGSQECQDKYDLFAGLVQHYKKYQVARILLTNDESLFQQISKEGIKFCLIKIVDEVILEKENSNKTLCYMRYKGKGKNGASYQFGGQSAGEKTNANEFFSAEDKSLGATSSEEMNENGSGNSVIELNKSYKKAKADLDALNAEGNNEKAAKERLYKMLDAVEKVILAKMKGIAKYTKSEARKLLLFVHVDKVIPAMDIFGPEKVANVLAFDRKYAEEAREVLDNALNSF